MSRIQLCIFDMDGLLIDSETVWYKNASACSRKYGYAVPDELILDTMGLNDIETQRRFMVALGEDFPYEEFISRTVELRKEYLDAHPLEKKKGLDILYSKEKESEQKVVL